MEERLLQILRCRLTGEDLPADGYDWSALIPFARKHNLLPYLSFAAQQVPEEQRPDAEQQAFLERAQQHAAAVYLHQQVALEELQTRLEAEQIDHLFFKGAVTRSRYPDPLLRPMGDIDFLYRPAQNGALHTALRALGYGDGEEGRKNDTYRRAPFVCLEAHRQLVPSDSVFFAWCSGVWERARLREGCRYTYEMTPEDEFVFQLIHLAIHFAEGGAGVRFLVDTFLYDRLSLDRARFFAELEAAGLTEFYRRVSALAQKWFGGGPGDDMSAELEGFIFSGGVFGSSDNAAALAVKEGRLRYLRRVCFPGYGEMVSMFPWLNGKKFLLPWAWFLRGVRGMTRRRKNVTSSLRRAQNGDAERGRDLSALFAGCGLPEQILTGKAEKE